MAQFGVGENTAVPSSESIEKSSIPVVAVGNPGSSTVDAQAPHSLPLRAPSPAHTQESSAEAVAAEAAATALSGEANAQNNRSATQGSASSSSPNSSSAVVRRAELVPRGAVGRKYLPGEKIELALKTDGTGHAYCFWLDEAKRVIRIHPNRFNTSALVSANTPLSLPGTSEFSLVAERPGADQSVECHVVANEMLSKLPANVAGADLAALSVRSLDEVRNVFAGAVGRGNLLLTARYVVRVEAR